MKLLLLPFILFLFLQKANAQAIVNTSLERNTATNTYARFNYSNDLFTATDFYLTQAFQFELAHPALGKIPIYKLLHAPGKDNNVYGFSIEHNVYTPQDYKQTEIQYGDRPFAAAFMLNTFTIHTDSERKSRWSSRLSMGVLGPAAFGKGMQTYIHKHTGNAQPKGWDNQIKNDLVLNYELNYQKEIVQINNHLLVTADALARLGTLNTKANIGLTLMLGIFKNPFAELNIAGKKFQLYAYDHLELNVLGYDATLQGGLLNRSSPYTISAAGVSRFVFQNNWGIVLQTGKIYLEYYQSYITKEFEQGLGFRNGGVQLGLKF